MRTIFCQNQCGNEIYFSDQQISKTGKKIPLDVKTQQPHQCPNSKFKKSQSSNEPATAKIISAGEGDKIPYKYVILEADDMEIIQRNAREKYEILQVILAELKEEKNPAVIGMIFKEVLEGFRRSKE